MSNVIFPVFPGLAWSVLKTPEWKTAVQTAVSGKEVRSAYQVRPKWHFTLSYEVLRNYSGMTEYNQMVGFYNARQGAFDSFLFQDDSDYLATAQSIGAGDGVTTDFVLLHNIGGWLEPIGRYQPGPVVYVNGSPVSFSTVGDNVVRLSSAPAAGAVVTWSGAFYYRARFAKDMMEFDQFMKDFWALKKCELIGVFDA